MTAPFQTPRPGRPLLRVALAVLLTTPAVASAADVVVVRSSDQAAFKAVEQAFLAEVPGAASLVSTTPGLDLKGALAGAKVVLAVGPEAARAALAARTGSAQVLVALSTEAELGRRASSRCSRRRAR